MKLYPDGPEDKAASKPEDSEEKNFLIPKSAFGGECKPGDIYKIKVVSVLDDELEVEPAGEDKKEEKEEKAETDPDGSEENPVDQYNT